MTALIIQLIGVSLSFMGVIYLGIQGLESWESYDSKYRNKWSDKNLIGKPGDWLFDSYKEQRKRGFIGFGALGIGFILQIIGYIVQLSQS